MAAEATEEPDERADEPTVQVVEFFLGDERYAVDVADVDSIVELSRKGRARVPRTTEAIDGVMDLRGEITAIINPRVHLDLDPEAISAEQRVLVLDQSKDKQKLGIRVDEVIGVTAYPESAIESPEVVEVLETYGLEQRTIRAIIKRDADEADFEPVAWLDLDEIIEQSRQSRPGRQPDQPDRDA